MTTLASRAVLPGPVAVSRRYTQQQLDTFFHKIPKVELHEHLSGSVPESLEDEFRKENGADGEVPAIQPSYRNLDEFLKVYRLRDQVQTPDQYRRAATTAVMEAASENVRRLEIRSGISGDSEKIVEAIEQGLREGQTLAKKRLQRTIEVGLIISARRDRATADTLAVAKKAVEFSKKPHSLVCGFDLTGDGNKPLWEHIPALRYADAHGLGTTTHCLEMPSDRPGDVLVALENGVDRIGHLANGVQAQKGFPFMLPWLKKRDVHIELCPVSNVQLKAVPSFQEHPLPTYLANGLSVSLNTDNRTMNATTQSDQLGRLYAEGVLTCWKQIKKMTYDAAWAAFAPPFEKLKLLLRIKAEFRKIEHQDADLIQIAFCRGHAHRK